MSDNEKIYEFFLTAIIKKLKHFCLRFLNIEWIHKFRF